MDKLIAKEHRTLPGLLSIFSIKAVFSPTHGLGASILEIYPEIVSIIKPEFIPSTEPLEQPQHTGSQVLLRRMVHSGLTIRRTLGCFWAMPASLNFGSVSMGEIWL